MNNLDFSATLLTWFAANGRKHLPWLENKDPYHIWLSEVILQQTRVEQGTPYFLKFRERYPTVFDLADAPDDDVMKTWEGLGYYSRARNMLFAARYVVNELGGEFPKTYEGIRSMRGVGPYTAAAVASFAFDLPYAVVDGNVYRVLTRVFGIETPTDDIATQKNIAALAQSLLPHNAPADFNQAIMDFGATCCTPATPKCATCPFQSNCFAFANNMQTVLPVRTKKIVKRTRFFSFIVARQHDDIWIHHRKGKDIWQDLYDFPSIETDVLATPQMLSEAFKTFLLPDWNIQNIKGPYKQQLTHQTIIGQFITLNLNTEWLPPLTNTLKIAESELHRYAFPKIIDHFLRDTTLTLF